MARVTSGGRRGAVSLSDKAPRSLTMARMLTASACRLPVSGCTRSGAKES